MGYENKQESAFVSVCKSVCLSLHPHLFHFSPCPSVGLNSPCCFPHLLNPVPLPIPSIEKHCTSKRMTGDEMLAEPLNSLCQLPVMSWSIYGWNIKCACMCVFKHFFYWCYAVCALVCTRMLCDVWWVMRRQMVHTPGFGGADMPTRETQARMEALHGCVCLSHTCVCARA